MIPAMGTASIIQTSPPKYPAADTDNKTNRGWSPTDLPTIFGYMKLDSICCISKSPAIASTAAGKPPDDKAVVLKPLSPPEKAEIKVGINPSTGPKYGIMFVSPAKHPMKTAYSTPISVSQREYSTAIRIESIKTPFMKAEMTSLISKASSRMIP